MYRQSPISDREKELSLLLLKRRVTGPVGSTAGAVLLLLVLLEAFMVLIPSITDRYVADVQLTLFTAVLDEG